MKNGDDSAARRLIETGAAVPFRIAHEEVLSGPVQAEFAFQLDLLFEGDEDDDPADIAAWGAIGFMFVVTLMSFHDARPRGTSELDYDEADMFRVSEFLEGLRFERGMLEYDGDYVRGRRVKTRIAVRSDGTASIETRGRGKASARWLARLKGGIPLKAVKTEAGDA